MQRESIHAPVSVREPFTDDELCLLHESGQLQAINTYYPPYPVVLRLRELMLLCAALGWGFFVLYPQAAIAIRVPALMLSSAWLQSLPHVVVGLCYVWGLWMTHITNNNPGFVALLLVDAAFTEWFWYDGGVL